METFVSFELAKKLKEKGFPQRTFGNYNMVGSTYYQDGRHYKYGCVCDKEDAYTAPTIAQVLKWLFDEKQLFVNIDCNICDKFGLFFTIYKKGEETWEACWYDENYYNKPEEAAIAGIEYVLNEII